MEKGINLEITENGKELGIGSGGMGARSAFQRIFDDKDVDKPCMSPTYRLIAALVMSRPVLLKDAGAHF